jgi:hypothetical protein
MFLIRSRLIVVGSGLICPRHGCRLGLRTYRLGLRLCRLGYVRLDRSRDRNIRIRFGYGNPCRSQNAIADAVSRLQDFHTGRALDALSVRMQQRLMDVRVEGITCLTKRLQAVLGCHPLDLLGHSLETTAELVVLAGLAYVVQYRKEVLQHTLNRHLASKITITVDAALVVHVLGLQPL